MDTATEPLLTSLPKRRDDGPARRPPARAALVARFLLGALFLWGGALKLSQPRAFAHVVDGYGLVPDGWPLVIAAFAIPGLELAAGIGVLLDRRGGYLLMLGMLALFLAVLGFAILAGLDVDCGCFSLAERRGRASLRQAFARDLAMTAAVAGCLLSRERGVRRGRDEPSTEEGGT